MLRTLVLMLLLAAGLACTGDSKKQQEMYQRGANSTANDTNTNTPDTRTTGQPNGTGNTDTSSNQANVPQQPGPATTPNPQASGNATTTQPKNPDKKK